MTPFFLATVCAATLCLATAAQSQSSAPAAPATPAANTAAAQATTGPVSLSAEHAEVSRLLRAGQLGEALKRAEATLATRPKDPQMRFLKGIIQSRNGQSAEALQTFLLITQDYPELPEPYNNLAALYAAEQRYDKARTALEMAIKVNPQYAVAHENLGDVYAALAAQSYARALELDPTQTALRPKIGAAQKLLTPPKRP